MARSAVMAGNAVMARSAVVARAAAWLGCALGVCGCDGSLVNLGASARPLGGAPQTWQVEAEPVLADPELILANPTLAADESELYYTGQARGADKPTQVFRSVGGPAGFGFGEPIALGTPEILDAASPAVAADASALWLGLLGTASHTDIWQSARTGDAWSPPTLVAELSSDVGDDAPRPPLQLGALELMPLASKRHGGIYYQLYLSTRSRADAAWSEPSQALVGALSSPAFQSSDGHFSADGLTLYFASNPDGDFDLYQAQRPTLDAPFAEPEPLSDLNDPSGASEERMPWLNPAGDRLYFASNRSNDYALYVARKLR